MSRFKKLWVLVAPMALLLGMGMMSPAQADGTAPPPPTASDVCGVSQDQFFTPNGSAGDDVGWKDSSGTLYSAGLWHSTGGAASVTLTAMVWNATGYNEYTYPPLTFGSEPDSSCVEAPDTVSTQVGACNTTNNGTQVEFTYNNVDDWTNLAHTRPNLQIIRWDYEQTAYIVWTEGQVPDGGQLSVTGGDTGPMGDGVPNHIFLAPGTYNLTLTTNEAGSHLLPNRLFVPACGTYVPPPGDPHGGPIPDGKPTAKIGTLRHHKVRVVMDARKTVLATRYRVVIDPRHGRTRTRVFDVRGLTRKVAVLRHQRHHTLIKVTFAGKTLRRRL